MDKNIQDQLKQHLEEKKSSLEKELSRFATKDPNVKGDWDSRFPSGMSGDSPNLEEAADVVEEYSTRLSTEYNLETQLKEVNAALERIEKGAYGICEKCKNPIGEDRLKVSPEARFCKDCTRS